MADWIHCNKCYQTYQPGIKLFLTDCGHLNCLRCRNIMNERDNDCLVCNKKQAQVIMLSKDIKPDIERFFKPLGQLLMNAKTVYDFQNQNQVALMKHLAVKYAYAKKEVIKSYAIIGNLKKENTNLKCILKGRQSRPPGGSGHATSTPLSVHNASSLTNDSISTMSKDPNFTLRYNIGSQVSGHLYSIPRPGHAQRLNHPKIKDTAHHTPSPSTPSPSVHVVPRSRSLAPIHRYSMYPRT